MYHCILGVHCDAYHQVAGQDGVEDAGEVGGDPVRKDEGNHLRDVYHEELSTMASTERREKRRTGQVEM